MVSFDDLAILSGITARRLQSGAAELASRGVIKPPRAGRLPMEDASALVAAISFSAMDRLVNTIATMTAMTAAEYIEHQARLMAAAERVRKHLPAPAAQRGKAKRPRAAPGGTGGDQSRET